MFIREKTSIYQEESVMVGNENVEETWWRINFVFTSNSTVTWNKENQFSCVKWSFDG